MSRIRSELNVNSAGALAPNRTYSQGEVELWFALSAFADNASNYEEITRAARNGEATVFAGRALVAAARRVDAAMQNARVSSTSQSAWSTLRRTLGPLESGM